MADCEVFGCSIDEMRDMSVSANAWWRSEVTLCASEPRESGAVSASVMLCTAGKRVFFMYTRPPEVGGLRMVLW